MTESEATSRAWSALRQHNLLDQVVGVGSIHLSTVQERQDCLGYDPLDVADYWYITFLLKLDENVVSQTPDSILVQIDNVTHDVEIVTQM